MGMGMGMGEGESKGGARSGGSQYLVEWLIRYEVRLAASLHCSALHSCRGADEVHADCSCSIGECRQVVGVYGTFRSPGPGAKEEEEE